MMNNITSFLNWILIVIVIMISSCTTPAPNETWVQTFEFDSITLRHSVFDFPDEGESYGKILMYYTLKCDERSAYDKYPCGEWDYLTYTNVHKDGEVFELARYITPYGKRLDLGPDGFTWIYDVTDYALLLKGKVELSSANTQELLDLRFQFIEGTPPREVLKIENLWKTGSYQYGKLSDDSVMQALSISLDSEASSFMIRSRISGHGHYGPHNCCEWDPKQHFILVNNVERFNWTVWRDCGMNPVYPQGGTWQFDRAGWCPGTWVDTYDHELTSYVSPGETIRVDYNPEEYNPEIEEKGGNYIIAHQLFSFGPPSFALDAEIEKIMAPTDHSEYLRMNPVSTEPIIQIRNRGSEPLTSLKIKYGLKGNVKSVYTWHGNLDFLESAQVNLPMPDWSGMAEGMEFALEVSKPNGRVDEYPQNNRLISTVLAPIVFPEEFEVVVSTPGFGRARDNAWMIFNAAGEVVAQHTEFEDDSTFVDHVSLSPGAYEFFYYDVVEDGMIRHWWLRGSDPDKVGQNGSLVFRNTQQDTIVDLGFDFAEEESLRFFVD